MNPFLSPVKPVAYGNMGVKRTTLSHFRNIITSIFVSSKLGLCTALSLAALSMVACSGQVPSKAEITQDNLENRAQQLLRVADTTRSGGDIANAMQLYSRAAEMRTDWPLPLLRLGETALSAGLYDDAFKAFQAATALVPNDTLALNGGGIALDLMGRHDEAQERYISGMGKTPDNIALKNNLGLSLALSGNFKEAVSLLQVAASDPRSAPRTRHNLALVHGLAGDDAAAREALASDLSEAQIANNLAFYKRLRTMSPEQRSKAVFGTLH